jgi:hypothetical protein
MPWTDLPLGLSLGCWTQLHKAVTANRFQTSKVGQQMYARSHAGDGQYASKKEFHTIR